MAPRFALGAALVMLLCGRAALAADPFDVSGLDDARVHGAVIVDTRPAALCGARSLSGAHCLPPGAFLGPHRRLASFQDIQWALGAAGIDASKTALVMGDDPTRRDFVAGILFLAGQTRVAILSKPISTLIAASHAATAPGILQGMIQDPVYRAWPRADLIVLRGELARALAGDSPPALLDGRGAASFWGRRIRFQRGGHLPGAQSLPLRDLRAEAAEGAADLPDPTGAIAYANAPFDSIAYFTRLRAGAGLDARVYSGGWRDWAAHTALPVDSETYPDRAPPSVAAPLRVGPSTVIRLDAGGALLLAAAVAVLALAAFHLGRTRT